MSQSPRKTTPANQNAKPPLSWKGVLFAFAANLLLVTVGTGLVQTLRLPIEFESIATLAAPLLTGALTAIYTGQRGAMHAFLGGMLSVLPLTFFIFGGAWQPALYAGAFCTIGGALAEIVLRRRAAVP